MIRIHLVAQERPDVLNLSVLGGVLWLNGDDLDLPVLPIGADIEGWQAVTLSPWIAGAIWRDEEALNVTLFLPYSGDCLDQHVLMPEPITVTHDGPVDVPWPTYSEVTEAPAPGGRNIITTTYRWRQPPQVETVFVADPPAPEPEPETEDAE